MSAHIEPWLRQILRCPVTGAALVDATGPDGEPELVSTDPAYKVAYPINDSVPVLLKDEARVMSHDEWRRAVENQGATS